MDNYTQLNSKERNLIDYLLNKENKTISEIAKIIKRSKSSASREIKRNKLKNKYDSSFAIFHSKITNLTKYKFSINKYENFLAYFYKNFNNKYFGVSACIFAAKKWVLKPQQ